MLIQGDCLEEIKKLDKDSIDTIITDPPYGLSFMGKKWDYDVPSKKIFQEMLRVTKPGGTLLCFAGSRTQHRMAVNVEDAGWILKDCIMWIYGSGFPKATDISKQLDKNNGQVRDLHKFTEWMRTTGLTAKELNEITNTFMGSHYLTAKDQPAIPTIKLWNEIKTIIKIEIPSWVDEMVARVEAEREVIGKQKNAMSGWNTDGSTKFKDRDITLAKTDEAKLWNGWKSHGLKPAYEPILVAMKPNDGSYANNALKWGVSGLNIDGGRIGHNEPVKETNRQKDNGDTWNSDNTGLRNNPGTIASAAPQGRFPANIILDEEAGKMLDEQSGVLKSGGQSVGKYGNKNKGEIKFSSKTGNISSGTSYAGQTGGASRFFYCAKASKSERNAGCEGLEEKEKKTLNEYKHSSEGRTASKSGAPMSNNHPTVKPLKLMEYLCTLTKTPTGGTVLDPFMGSGTTGVACKNTGRDFIGIELDPEYIKIAEARINNTPEKLF